MRDDERRVAAIAHVLNAIPMWGVLGVAAIWMYYKEKSREVVFHAQQAIFFQVTVLAFCLVFVVVGLFKGIIGLISPSLAGFIGGINELLLILSVALYAAVCLYGALQTWNGADFVYPIVGQRMAEGYRKSMSDQD